MDDSQFQTAVSILFVTYILSEVPSNLVLKKLTPSRWIAFITVAWGIIATLTGIVQSYGGLIACRLLLGAVEGGLFPGMAVYLTFFYTKRELALRIGYLFVSAALAGACGGLLAYAIGHMDGTAGLRGWRWIMILEGIPTFALGIATWFILPKTPETAYFFTAEEKAFAAARLKRQTGYTKKAAEFHWDDVRKCVKDWKVWVFCFAQFGSDTMLYGYSTFLPTIIRSINTTASSAMIQVLTIPCYALGAITYLVVARFSDKQQKRGFYSILLGVVSIVGYAILISDASSGVHYAGCFLVAMGLYVCVGLPLAWLPTNLPRYGKRTTATGLQLSIGNCAGIMSAFVSFSSAPRLSMNRTLTKTRYILQRIDLALSRAMELLWPWWVLLVYATLLCGFNLDVSTRDVRRARKSIWSREWLRRILLRWVTIVPGSGIPSEGSRKPINRLWYCTRYQV
jgi:MFS family permease